MAIKGNIAIKKKTVLRVILLGRTQSARSTSNEWLERMYLILANPV